MLHGVVGRPHEGAAYDGYDSVIDATYDNMMPYTTMPNVSHPSHPDYAGATVLGVGEDAIGGGSGNDAVYADEDLEDDEEDAAEAAREARDQATRPSGRRKKSVATAAAGQPWPLRSSLPRRVPVCRGRVDPGRPWLADHGREQRLRQSGHDRHQW